MTKSSSTNGKTIMKRAKDHWWDQQVPITLRTMFSIVVVANIERWVGIPYALGAMAILCLLHVIFPPASN